MSVMDLDRPATARSRRVGPIALALVAAGVVGGLAALSLDRPVQAVRPATYEAHTVRFEWSGAVEASHASITRYGATELVSSLQPHKVAGPAVVVLVVSADVASCRIYMDGAVVASETRARQTATCVWSVNP